MAPKGRDLRVNGSLSIPIAEISVSHARSSGPGGQNVNKVNTKVVIRWNVRTSSALSDAQRARLIEKLSNRLNESGTLTIASDRFRSQSRNFDDALEKLATVLKKALSRPKKRKKTRTPRSAVETRLKEKRHRSEKKRLRRLKD